MANKEHVRILRQGAEVWNEWRQKNLEIVPDLREANLFEAKLRRANLYGANLDRANLGFADLWKAELSGAHLTEANLIGVNLTAADLSKADLNKANLSYANLVETNLENANLTGCRIYGISAWDVNINKKTKQLDLVITKSGEPDIKVDDLEVAQFIYLLLNNEKLRNVIETVTSKVVLILGRFTKERKKVLDALRDELRKRNYTPILFDFEPPRSRDLTETISTLAHMARFIIADITNAKSIPQELSEIVPNLPSVPIQPLLFRGSSEYGMYEHFKRYPWVLAIHRYRNLDDLRLSLKEKVIRPAEAKVKELRQSEVK